MHGVTPAALLRLLARAGQLKSFQIRSVSKFPFSFDVLASSHLSVLSLRGCAPTEATLLAFVGASRNMLEVDFGGVHSVTNRVLDLLLDSSPALEALSVENCVKVTDHFIAGLPKRHLQLRYLNIADVPRIRLLEGLLPPTLVSLECSSHVAPPSLPSLPELQSLICSFNKHVGAQYWNGHHHLLTLGLSGCALIDDIALRLIALNSPHLQTLNVSRCRLVTDVGLQSVATCTNLRELSLVDDLLIHDLTCLAQLTELRVLLIGGCVLVSDLSPVLRNCRHLAVLHAASCNVDDVGMQALFAGNCFPPQLERFDLSDCKKIGAPGARAICSACPKLRSLSVDMLQNTQDRQVALQMVQREFPLIRIRGTGLLLV